MRVSDLKQLLEQFYDDTDIIAYHIWTKEDVLLRAQDTGVLCTTVQADEILEVINDTKDAEYGITWDTIDYHLAELEKDEPNDQ